MGITSNQSSVIYTFASRSLSEVNMNTKPQQDNTVEYINLITVKWENYEHAVFQTVGRKLE